MTTCPRCHLPREPHAFLTHKGKTSKWCDLCREAYVMRLRSLGMAKEPSVTKAAITRTPLDALLNLARLSGAAKHKAIELVQVHRLATGDLRVRKAWGNHYGLEAKLLRARRKYEATSEGLGPIIEVGGER